MINILLLFIILVFSLYTMYKYTIGSNLLKFKSGKVKLAFKSSLQLQIFLKLCILVLYKHNFVNIDSTFRNKFNKLLSIKDKTEFSKKIYSIDLNKVLDTYYFFCSPNGYLSCYTIDNTEDLHTMYFGLIFKYKRGV